MNLNFMMSVDNLVELVAALCQTATPIWELNTFRIGFILSDGFRLYVRVRAQELSSDSQKSVKVAELWRMTT